MTKKRETQKRAAGHLGGNGQVTAADRIREHKRQHPQATTTQIAKALKLPYQRVYNVLTSKQKRPERIKANPKESSRHGMPQTVGNPLPVANGIRAVELAFELLQAAGDQENARAALVFAGKLGGVQ